MDAISGHRILLLSYFFPPLASAGGHRTGALARHLARLGAAVDVVSVKYGLDVEDPALLARLPASVTVRRVPSLEGAALRHRIRDRVKHGRLREGDERSEAPGVTPAGAGEPGRASLVQRSAMALSWGLSAARVAQPWALRRAIFGVTAMRAVRRAIRRERPDVLLVSLGPMCQTWAALLGARGSGVPVVFDFRDLWTTAPEYFTSVRGYAIGRPAYLVDRLVERWALRRCDWFVVNHEHMRVTLEGLAPRARDRVTVIPNGYDEDDFAALAPSANGGDPAGRPLTVRSIGTTYIHTAKSLLDACERLPAEAAARLRIELIGPWYDAADQLERAERMPITRVLPPRPHAEALAAMAGADVLLFVLRDMPGVADAIPARLYEYLRLGKPMLAVAPDGAAKDLVEQNGGTVVRPGDDAALGAALERIARGELPGAADPTSPRVTRFSRAAQAAELGATLAAVARSADGAGRG